MKHRYIIWDWNGTLLDDAFLCRDVMNGILRERDLPIMSRRRYEKIFDFPVENYYRQLGFDFGRESFEKLGTEFIATYERRKASCRLRKHARRILASFKNAGMRQALLSAYRHETLLALVETKRLGGAFDWIMGADDHYARGKEAQGRELFNRIAAPHNRMLLIGDTVHDHEVAAAIGVDCLLIYSGHQSKKKLEGCGRPVLDSLKEAMDWVMGAD